MLKKIEIVAVWAQLLGCCIIVLCLICVSKVCSDGNTENQVVKFMLNHVAIQTVVEDDKWSIEYPFDESRDLSVYSWVKSVEKSVDNYCTTSFPGRGLINKIVSEYKNKVMHYQVSSIPSISDNYNYASRCADNVIAFKDDVNSLGIPFFYVQTPLQESVVYYNESDKESTNKDYVNRSVMFTQLLEDEGVDIVNIARDYSDGITYDLSSHWKCTDALQCTRLLAQKLNEQYDFNIDMSVYDTDRFYDLMQYYPEEKAYIENNDGYEYIVPTPKSGNVIKLIYAEEKEWCGDFEQVIFNQKEKWKLGDSAYHNIFRIRNSLVYSILNNEALCEKKVLIIGDSFDWPIIAYLSLSCKEVIMIHNESFNGSLISFLKKNNPDIVMIVYNDAEFDDAFIDDAYDLK